MSVVLRSPQLAGQLDRKALVDLKENPEKLLETLRAIVRDIDEVNRSIPLTSRGDLLTRDSEKNVRLPIGSDYQELLSLSGPKWDTRPACTVKRTANQSIPDSTPTFINFDSEVDDNDGLHSNVTNNNRITFSRPGRWLIRSAVRFTGNATGARRHHIRLNGTTDIASCNYETVTAIVQDLQNTVCRRFVIGDYIESRATQTSGAALDVVAIADISPFLEAVWLSP